MAEVYPVCWAVAAKRPAGRSASHGQHREPPKSRSPSISPGRVEHAVSTKDSLSNEGAIVALLDTADLQSNVALGRGANRRGRAGRVAGRLAGGGDHVGRSGPEEGGPRLGRPRGRLAAARKSPRPRRASRPRPPTQNACGPIIAGPRCSISEDDHGQNSTPPELPTRWPSKDIASRKNN